MTVLHGVGAPAQRLSRGHPIPHPARGRSTCSKLAFLVLLAVSCLAYLFSHTRSQPAQQAPDWAHGWRAAVSTYPVDPALPDPRSAQSKVGPEEPGSFATALPGWVEPRAPGQQTGLQGQSDAAPEVQAALDALQKWAHSTSHHPALQYVQDLQVLADRLLVKVVQPLAGKTATLTAKPRAATVEGQRASEIPISTDPDADHIFAGPSQVPAAQITAQVQAAAATEAALVAARADAAAAALQQLAAQTTELRERHKAILHASINQQRSSAARIVDSIASARVKAIYAGLVDASSIDVSDMPPDWLSTEPGSTERTTNAFAPQEWQRLVWRGLKAALLTHYQPPDTDAIYAVDSAHLASLPSALQKRCRGTVGNWCGRYDLQQPLAPKAPPHGQLECPENCNGVGVCQASYGYCLCPAGWAGAGCTVRQRRPCTNRRRPAGWEPMSAAHLSIADKGWTDSRCGGVCNEDLGACFCNGTYGHVPPPLGSPPGTLPLRMGRPMILSECNPRLGEDGEDNKWGLIDNDKLFNTVDGWCEAEQPAFECICLIDGFGGKNCASRYEMSCVNQCAGHGDCWLGFCTCHPGYYGTDCAQTVQGHPQMPGLEVTSRPWLNLSVATPAAADPPALKERRRPLIYVYDLPPDYNTHMLQYRNDYGECFHRHFHHADNATLPQLTMYTIETALHEMLLQSEHRTFDPEEADYFYAPVYVACGISPVNDFADHPWWWGPGGPRTMHAAQMLLEAKWWIEKTFPQYWRRRSGRDHIWLIPHDEGGCWAPTEIWSGIILSHWGRRDYPHASGTAYRADNYSDPYEPSFRGWAPHDWRHLIANHPCYNPAKDLLIPPVQLPEHLAASPLLGALPRERTTLLFMRGDVGAERLPNYSRGIRQQLYRLSRELGWREKHNVRIDAWGDSNQTYSQLLASSIFCAAVPGDGWARRAEEALLHGCVPVVIMDDVDEKFSTAVDWSAISVRVAEADVARVVDILLAIPPLRVQEMQHNIGLIWHRFRYTKLPLYAEQTRVVNAENKYEAWGRESESPLSLPGVFTGDPAEDDALATILQWLYAKIPDTR